MKYLKYLIVFIIVMIISCKKFVREPNGNIKYWSHVYDYGRLTIIKNQVETVGVIKESEVSEDGDQIYRLSTPDTYLLNIGNVLMTHGYLILEVICVNPVHKDYVGTKCECYVNDVILPQVGDTVKVTGPWVYDKHHGWNEIHPVTNIIIR